MIGGGASCPAPLALATPVTPDVSSKKAGLEDRRRNRSHPEPHLETFVSMSETWEIEDLARAESPAIAAGVAYWREKAGAAAMPSRAQIDPLEMRAFLRKILIIDVMENGDFVYRLCGTEITEGNLRDLTGRRADAESLGASAPQFLDAYRRTVAARAPVFFIGRMWWQDRGYVSFEQVMLPLSSDGGAVDKLLCVVDFEVRAKR
jgi:hypothetical protein